MWETVGNWFGTIFKERTTSPLYGTFILSWCLANWRIVYLTLFVDQELTGNKIYVIDALYLDWRNLLFWPIVSTVFLIYVAPRLANEAYKVALSFSVERRKILESLESNRMLSVEESELIQQNADSRVRRAEQRAASIELERQELDNGLKASQERVVELREAIANDRQTFEIVTARYGTDLKYTDATGIIASMLKPGVKGSFWVNNNVFGDPDPGQLKSLLILYRRDGKGHVFFASEGRNVAFDWDDGHYLKISPT
jgi:hypothetical protein